MRISNSSYAHSDEVKFCSDFILGLLLKCGESNVVLAARSEIETRKSLQQQSVGGEGLYEVRFGNGTPVVVTATVEADSAADAVVVIGYELQRHMEGGGLIEIRPVDERVGSIGIRITPESALVRMTDIEVSNFDRA